MITVAAVVFRDAEGRVLSVRKRGTDRYMLPGGKPEPGESPVEAAAREVAEELGVVVGADDLELLGEFEAEAANEPGHVVRSTVFTYAAPVTPAAAAEIAELRWSTLDELRADPAVAALTAEHVVPALTEEALGRRDLPPTARRATRAVGGATRAVRRA